MPQAPGRINGTWLPVSFSEAVKVSSSTGPGRFRGASSPPARHGTMTLVGVFLLPLMVMAFAGKAPAAVLLSQEEALALAFPGARVERRTAYLDGEQIDEVKRLAGPGVEPARAMMPYYLATHEGETVGVAYFDTRRVRAEAATVMYVVDPTGRLARVEVIAFNEPREYLPRPAWLQQFTGRALDKDLALKRGIRGMTGASLTARMVTAGARRILALHTVIAPLKKMDPPAKAVVPAPGAGDEQ